MSRPAVFFDRDDTLMVNVPYLGDPRQVEAFAEAAVAMSELQEAGFVLLVVSNQSGVGRGMITREQVEKVNIELSRQLGGKLIHAFYSSFATPDDPVPNDRKPSPLLLHTAAKEHDLDLSRSFFIGDRLSDIECGLAGGCRTVLLTQEKSSRKGNNDPKDIIARKKANHIAENLHDAVAYILAESAATK